MSWSQARRRLLAIAVIAIAVAGVCSWALVADRLDGVQHRWEDQLQAGLEPSDDVLIVGIDRSTLAATMPWPWPREVQAELLDAIGAGDPAVVVYDVLLDTSRPGDSALTDAIARTPTVLPTALTLTIPDGGPSEIVDAVVPTDELASAAAGVGHANVLNAGDTGIVRTVPLYAIDERGIARPSIALAAIAAHDGFSGPLTERPDGVQLGDRFVPLEGAELRINWSESLSQGDVIPAIDVLAGAIDPAGFRGRVVVVGITEPTLGDQHLVPVDRSGGTSGVVIIANAINTILSSGYLHAPSTASQVALVALVAAVVAVLVGLGRLVPALIVAIALAAGVILFASWRFHADGALWNVVWPVLAVLAAAAAGTVLRYLTEVRHRRRAWRLFATYVPAEVVRQLEDPGRLATAMAGVRRDVTVVYSDIRGITALSGSLEPARLRQLLTIYYEYAVAIIKRHRGTVMQFVGDEVFAVFGVPLDDHDAGDQALRCALELQAGVAMLDERLAAADLPPVRFGVGVHRGSVVAAHVGTEVHRQYAVVGECVNVGGRLCEAAAAGEVVVSEAAWSAGTAEVQRHFAVGGPVELRGVRAPVSLYRVTQAPRDPDPGATGTPADQPEVRAMGVSRQEPGENGGEFGG